MDNKTKEQLNDDYVGILRLLKGVVVRIDRIGTELTKEQQLLGDKFAEFVQTKLPPDLREAQLFMTVAVTPGLEAEKFTPPVEVKLPRLLEVFGQIVGIWTTINGGSAPEPPTNGSTAVSDEAPAAACAGPTNTAAVGSTLITTSEAPTLTDDVVLADAPAGSDLAADQEVARAAIPDILTGITTPVEQADATADNVPAVAEATPPRRPRLTAEQHQFLRDRSVTLLVKVNKGELTVEEAMRQAEKMPIRRVR